MNAPLQPKHSSSGGPTAKQIVVLTVAAVVWMVLLCAGIVGGVLFIARDRVANVVEGAKGALTGNAVPQTDWDDWHVQRQLTHLYQTALESISADTALAEKLGEPIEPALTSDELFERTGGVIETVGIAFDIQGPKGTGTVTVQFVPGQLHAPESIQVKLGDESVVEVVPLDRPLPPVR
jgi:hypothetical protein